MLSPSTWPTASLSSTLNTAMPLSVALLRSNPVWFSCSALDFTLYLLGFVPHTLERSPAVLHSQQAAHFFRCLWSTLPCYNYSSSIWCSSIDLIQLAIAHESGQTSLHVKYVYKLLANARQPGMLFYTEFYGVKMTLLAVLGTPPTKEMVYSSCSTMNKPILGKESFILRVTLF